MRAKSLYDFLTQMARRLKLAQPVVSTAQYLCHVHRLAQASFHADQMNLYAAALYLAAKMHNKHRSIADFVEVFYGFKYGGYQTPSESLTKERSQQISEHLQRAEKDVANALDFDFDIELPYPFLSQFREVVGESEQLDRVVQTASFFLNDIFMTQLVMFFHPLVLAMACLKMAREYLETKEGARLAEFPDVTVQTETGEQYELGWWKVLDERVDFASICEVQRRVERFYQKCQETLHKKKQQ